MAELTSALAVYFRSIGNEWQTARHIAVGMNTDIARVRMMLTNNAKNGHLERSGEPRHYRFKEGALDQNSVEDVKATYSAATAAAEFCRRHNVTVPYEATRNNPEALTEWTEMLAR